MRRLVIHAGFHKTGTTSVQQALADNAALLAPHLRICLRAEMQPLIDKARGYSLRRSAQRRHSVFEAARAVFAGLATETRPVLVSAEDLSGFMPGRREVRDYEAVPAIMAEIERGAEAALGALDLTFYFSTRQPRLWVKSLWWQNLRNHRLDMDLPKYRRKTEAIADLDRVVRATGEAVARARVEAVSLDITQSLPEGPLTPLLELLELPSPPRGALLFGPPANRRPEVGLERVFLELNRSGLSDELVMRTKTLLQRAARREAKHEKDDT
jgi:hypothetical protein